MLTGSGEDSSVNGTLSTGRWACKQPYIISESNKLNNYKQSVAGIERKEILKWSEELGGNLLEEVISEVKLEGWI